MHVLPVHMLWFHGDKAPSLPKEDGQHKNALTDEGKSLQVPAKLGEVTPVESQILFGGNIPVLQLEVDPLFGEEVEHFIFEAAKGCFC